MKISIWFFGFLLPWYCFLLYRSRSAYIFHPWESKALIWLHVLLLSLFGIALGQPYASSGLPMDNHGRSFGMARLLWNPMLGIYAHSAFVLFPYSWMVWVQQRRLHFLMLLAQVAFAIAVSHWQSLVLPNACDYEIPTVKAMSLCG